MKLQISKDYRIASDQYSWLTQKYAGVSTKTGEQVWKTIAYHSTIDACAKSLANRMLRDSPATTLADAIKDARIAREAIRNAFSLDFDVVERR